MPTQVDETPISELVEIWDDYVEWCEEKEAAMRRARETAPRSLKG